MELDDVAEKARRNLMMVSTGILAVWVLGIPLDGKLVGTVNLSAVEPWRAWFCVAVVLIYFALRYHYAPTSSDSPEKVDATQAWKSRRRKWFVDNRELLINLSRGIYNSDGTPSSKGSQLTFRIPNRPEGERLALLEMSSCIWNGRHGKYRCRWARVLKDETDPEVTMMATQFVGEEHQAEVAIRPLTYLGLHFRAWKHAYKLSWPLLELSVPWMAAFVAAVVCICKLAASLYCSFPFVRQLLPA